MTATIDYHRARFFESASCNRIISSSEIKSWKFEKKKGERIHFWNGNDRKKSGIKT